MQKRSIKELAPKPSDAIKAMIDGLINQNQRDDFEIEMRTFGASGMNMCYGNYRIPPEFLSGFLSEETNWFMKSDPDDNSCWEKEIYKIEKYIEHLKSIGL